MAREKGRPLFKVVGGFVTALVLLGAGYTVGHASNVKTSPNVKASASAETKATKLISLSSRMTIAPNPTVYEQLQVTDELGHTQIVDVRKTPVSFFNYMDTDNLKAFASIWGSLKEKPTLICTGWPKGTKMADVIQQTKAALTSTGLTQATVYYLNDSNPYLATGGKYVSGLPDTYVWKNSLVYHVPGVLPSATDWIQVFGGN